MTIEEIVTKDKRYKERTDYTELWGVGVPEIWDEDIKETITTIADDRVDRIADILVEMNKAFRSPSYCEGINKYNVRGIYKYWAKRILEIV